MSDKFYRFQEWYIPERMMPEIKRYIEEGILPGDFLTKVFENDFVHALGQADEENLRNIQAYAAYLYNEVPMACRGSKEAMIEWVALKRKQNCEGAA